MTAGLRGYECRLGRAGMVRWPGSFSCRARRDIYGRINPWIAVVVLVVIAVAGGIIPTLVLHGSRGHPKEVPVSSFITTNTSAKKTHSGNSHGTAKLSVTLSASPAQLDVYPIISGYLGVTGTGIKEGGTARYKITVSNTGNTPLMDTVLRVSAMPLGGNGPWYSNNGQDGQDGIYCPSYGKATGSATGSMSCYVGSKVGYMAPATSDTLAIDASYSELPSAPASLTLHVSVSGIAPDGKVATATASPVSVRVIPVNYSDPLHIQLSFQPDPVALNQVFRLIVTLTNESTTSSIRDVRFQVPVLPAGDAVTVPKGFLGASAAPCQTVDAVTWYECLLSNSLNLSADSLAPGASRSLELAEIVSEPGYPVPSVADIEVQASGVLSSGVVAYGKSGDGTQTYQTYERYQTYRNLLGKISSGVVVLATATGYVNIS